MPGKDIKENPELEEAIKVGSFISTSTNEFVYSVMGPVYEPSSTKEKFLVLTEKSIYLVSRSGTFSKHFQQLQLVPVQSVGTVSILVNKKRQRGMQFWTTFSINNSLNFDLKVGTHSFLKFVTKDKNYALLPRTPFNFRDAIFSAQMMALNKASPQPGNCFPIVQKSVLLNPGEKILRCWRGLILAKKKPPEVNILEVGVMAVTTERCVFLQCGGGTTFFLSPQHKVLVDLDHLLIKDDGSFRMMGQILLDEITNFSVGKTDPILTLVEIGSMFNIQIIDANNDIIEQMQSLIRTARDTYITNKSSKSTTPQGTIIKETKEIREVIVKVPCGYCGTLVDHTLSKCPNCGAPVSLVKTR